MSRLVDLHIHSCYSDGIHTPATLVRLAADNGLAAIALADHDAVEGIDEALAAGAEAGVEVIPAVELSVELGRYRDLHLLGYCIDHRDAKLRQLLAEYRAVRDNRGKAIVDKINRRLVAARQPPISYDEVLDGVEGADGRPHIGRVLVGRGHASTMEDAFRKFLIPCDVPKRYLPAGEAIAQIHRAGGIAVLAHPTTVTEDRRRLREVIVRLLGLGLDGIEVYNNMCYKDDMLFLESLATEHGLLMTGGSDYHGFEEDVQIGIGRGGLAVSYRLAEAVMSRAASRRNETESPLRHDADHG